MGGTRLTDGRTRSRDPIPSQPLQTISGHRFCPSGVRRPPTSRQDPRSTAEKKDRTLATGGGAGVRWNRDATCTAARLRKGSRTLAASSTFSQTLRVQGVPANTLYDHYANSD